MHNRTLIGRRSPNIAPQFGPRASYNPLFQADQAQLLALQQAVQNGSIPLGEAIARIVAKNLPPQVHNVPFSTVLLATNVPQLLIPSNNDRMSYIIGNTSGTHTMTFSFDFPVAKTAAGIPVGLILPSQTQYQETNGTVSINEIWVWGTAGDFVAAFEGTLSLTGNRL